MSERPDFGAALEEAFADLQNETRRELLLMLAQICEAFDETLTPEKLRAIADGFAPEGGAGVMASSFGIHTVTVHVYSHGKQHSFTCPNCGATVKYDNKFPVGFDWKVCRSCGVQWNRMPGQSIGPHAEYAKLEPGETLTVTIAHGFVARGRT
jgi:predicted RNA-binding Zn-ribbon protein involved in translation (DUF1610 family)